MCRQACLQVGKRTNSKVSKTQTNCESALWFSPLHSNNKSNFLHIHNFQSRSKSKVTKTNGEYSLLKPSRHVPITSPQTDVHDSLKQPMNLIQQGSSQQFNINIFHFFISKLQKKKEFHRYYSECTHWAFVNICNKIINNSGMIH